MSWTARQSWIDEKERLSSNCGRSTKSLICLRNLLSNEKKSGDKICRTLSNDETTSCRDIKTCRNYHTSCRVRKTRNRKVEKYVDGWALRHEQHRRLWLCGLRSPVLILFEDFWQTS